LSRAVSEEQAAAAPVDTAPNGGETCAACGSGSLVTHFEVAGEIGAEGLIPTTKEFGTAMGNIVRCTNCGHMQLERFPSEEELNAEYAKAASDDYVDEEAGQRVSAARVLERTERYVKPGKLLDLGSWVGFLMAEARDRGWDPVGIEPSTFASDYARDKLGLTVRTDDLYTADLPEAPFDAVVMGDVLEHLTRAGDALDRIKTLLKPDGVLVLLLPDAGSRTAKILGKRWWSVIPTHIHFFTRHSAATMLRRHGYEPLYAATDPKDFTWEYYLNKGGGYLPGLSKRLIAMAQKAGVAEKMFTPDFGDRMIMIARPVSKPAGD
jgi:SAM-dependent methyltransferase